MEGAPKLHLKLMQKANNQLELHRPRFGVAAGMAIIGAAITTALILSPLNFAMGQDNKTDTATQKKKAEEKAPPQIIAARLDTTFNKTKAVVSKTEAIAKDGTKLATSAVGVKAYKVSSNGSVQEFDNGLDKYSPEFFEKLVQQDPGLLIMASSATYLPPNYFAWSSEVPLRGEKLPLQVFVGIGLTHEDGIWYNRVWFAFPEKNGERVGKHADLNAISDPYMRKFDTEMDRVIVRFEHVKGKPNDYIIYLISASGIPSGFDYNGRPVEGIDFATEDRPREGAYTWAFYYDHARRDVFGATDIGMVSSK